MVSNVRHRSKLTQPHGWLPLHEQENLSSDARGRSSDGVSSVSLMMVLLVVACKVLIFYLLVRHYYSLPNPVTLDNVHIHPGRFFTDRARSHLKVLTDIGPKVAGTYPNEVLAIDYLTRQVEHIITMKHPRQFIHYEHQRETGSYFLDYKPYGFVNYYNGVQNLIVRVGSKNSSALLVNCHFDSVPTSPGSSDDGLNCAVMLEVLAVLSLSNTPLRHDVIFLFNGAEESPLQASHAFITRHRWARDVRAFINLEACGAGGREILFQTGPNHPWLVKMYAQSAPHPHGSALGEEIFQSGIIPSDTDFRIFRDFGNIPGLDFAHTMNGYVYHTKFDNMDYILNGTLQHTGDNILALVKKMASSDELENPSLHSKGRATYFDIMGWYMVVYEEAASMIVNVVTAVVSLYTVIKGTRLSSKGGSVVRKLTAGLAIVAVSVIISMAAIILIAQLFHLFGSTMSWYSRPYLVVFLYYCPCVMILSGSLVMGSHFLKRQLQGVSSEPVKVQLLCNCIQLFWSAVLLFMTFLRLRTSFVLVILVACPTLVNACLQLTGRYTSHKTWLLIYSIMSFIPSTYLYYLTFTGFGVFIPIAGRMGPGKNPELIIGGLSALTCLLSECYLAPFIFMVRKSSRVLKFLLLLFVASLAAVSLTPLGFPFRGDVEQPSPQRVLIFHVEQSFRIGVNDHPYHKGSGYWLVPLDPHSPGILQSAIKEIGNIEKANAFCNQIFCGLPVYSPRLIYALNETYWIKAPSPRVPASHVYLHLRQRRNVSSGIERLTFQLSSPGHLSLYISPKSGRRVEKWSFNCTPEEAELKWNNRTVYFINYGGGYTLAEWDFWIEIPMSHSLGSVVDIAVCNHNIEYISQNFQNLLQKFPSWTHLTAWSSTYDSFQF